MNYAELELDREVRMAAFSFLLEQTGKFGEFISFNILSGGFQFKGTRVPLIGPQGIFKPKVLPEIPLSILTAPEKPGKPRPYDDRPAEAGVMVYRYRGTIKDFDHPDNVGLRKAMAGGFPLVYLFGVEKGIYKPIWPCFIIEDHPEIPAFHVMVDEVRIASDQDAWSPHPEADLRRRYITVEVQRRLHQDAFRARLLRAYQNSCAVCRLRHPELLEAAHIFGDKHPRGIPAVSNGLAMCAIHHKAFDYDILGIKPDYSIEIREDVLHEIDGPMLRHGLQGFQGKVILLPRRIEERPDREGLEERYRRFKSA